MNAAKLEKSGRLRRTLAYLRKNSPATTREIVAGANVCAVNSCVAELRQNGYNIMCNQRNIGGTMLWFYTYMGSVDD